MNDVAASHSSPHKRISPKKHSPNLICFHGMLLSSINEQLNFFSEANRPSPLNTLQLRKKGNWKLLSVKRSVVFPVFFKKRGMKKQMERMLRVSELAMRLAAFGFAVAASALVGSDREVRMFFSLEKRARFTDMKVLVFLVVANGISAGYNLLQLVRCFVGMMKGGVVIGKGFAFVLFSCDQIIAYVTLSAMAAAAQSAVLGLSGQPEFQWMKICNLYGRFCRQAGEGVACAVIACLAMIIISCISAFNFFRLYGSNKGWKNSHGSCQAGSSFCQFLS